MFLIDILKSRGLWAHSGYILQECGRKRVGLSFSSIGACRSIPSRATLMSLQGRVIYPKNKLPTAVHKGDGIGWFCASSPISHPHPPPTAAAALTTVCMCSRWCMPRAGRLATEKHKIHPDVKSHIEKAPNRLPALSQSSIFRTGKKIFRKKSKYSTCAHKKNASPARAVYETHCSLR